MAATATRPARHSGAKGSGPVNRVDPAGPLLTALDAVRAASLLGLGRLIKVPTQPLLELLTDTTQESA